MIVWIQDGIRKMRQMIKQFVADSLNYFTKMHCLKRIDKACDKYHKLERRVKLQGCVVNEMIKRYKELYGEDLRNKV